MPFNHILRICIHGYKLHKSEEKIYHLIYMDDIKLFAKNLKELETLTHAVGIYNEDIEKRAMLIIKSGQQQMTGGIELPNKKNIRTLGEKENYKYSEILEADTIKHAEMKEKILKEYFRRMRKLIETKLHSRNLIKGINTWAVLLVRYSGPFFNKWIREQENSWLCMRPYIPEVMSTDCIYQEK